MNDLEVDHSFICEVLPATRNGAVPKPGKSAFAVVGLAALLTACAGSWGFDRVRGVEEERLLNKSVSEVVKLLGAPSAYYATPDGHTRILAYDTPVGSDGPSAAGCLLLAAGGGYCPTNGGSSVTQCVALRFGPDQRLVEIDRPQLIAGPCAEKSDDRFRPATRRPLDTIPR